MQRIKIRIEEMLLFLTVIVFPLDKVISLTGIRDVANEGLTLHRLFAVMLFGVCLWRVLRSKDTEMLRLLFGSAFSISAICFLAVSFLSVLASNSPGGGLKQIFIRINLFAFCVLLVYIIRDRRGLRLCMLGLVIASIFSVTAGVYEMITKKPVIEEVRYSDTIVRTELYMEDTGSMRVQGLSDNPNMFGAELILMLGVVLSLITTTTLWRWRIFGGGLAFLIVVVIVATASRAAWLGLVLLLATFLFAAPLRNKRLFLASAAGSLCLAIIVITLFFSNLAVLDRARNITGSSKYGISFRTEMLRLSLKMGWQNPWLGVGSGNFRNEYFHIVGRVPFLPKKVAPSSHNEFATVFAETGIIGLIAYCLIHLTVVWYILYSFRSSSDAETKCLAAGLLASFVAFLFCLNFYPVWGNKFGWAVMGLAMALAKVLRTERAREQNCQPNTL